MTARANQIVAQLTLAKGKWMDSDTLAKALGIGKPQVSAAVSEARSQLGYPIETHPIRAVGWRLPPDTMSPAPPAEPPLSRNGEKMLAMLEAAAGEFVSGKVLADPLGIYPSELGRIAKHIMLKRPGLVVEGERGRGYRLRQAGTVDPEPPTAEPAKLPQAPLPKHVSHRAGIELLALLAPQTAERVRDIALESGQTATAAMERLIWYGIEVHRDLIASGEHPLRLERAA